MTWYRDITETQRHLICRQKWQVLARLSSDTPPAVRLAARSFMPTKQSLCFRGPFVPVGSLIVAVLSSYPAGVDGESRERLFFRGFAARFDRQQGMTIWEAASSRFCHDLALHARPEGKAKAMSLDREALLQMALDLDSALIRATGRHFPLPGFCVLPPTLLAVPAGTSIKPEDGSYVRIHAYNHHIEWREAWEDMRSMMFVPAADNTVGADLIDCRIAPRGLTTLGEYHDLRGLLGRHLHNPARSFSKTDPFDEPAIIHRMRAALGEPMRYAATPAELLEAFANPRQPLCASNLAAIQVWRPPLDGASAGAFLFTDSGHSADLWHTRQTLMSTVDPCDRPSPRNPQFSAV